MRAHLLQAKLIRSAGRRSTHHEARIGGVIFRAIWRLLALIWISLFAVAAQAVDSRTICGETVTSASSSSIDPNAPWLDGNSIIYDWGGSVPLGLVSSSETDQYSILNASGDYGSPSSTLSIFNGGGIWGSTSNYEGACNPLAPYPPVIYWYGNALGVLTANPYFGADRIDPRELVAALLKKAYGTATTTTSTTSSSTTSTTSAATTTTTTSTVTTTTVAAAPDAVPNAWSTTLAYVGGNYASSSVSVIDTSKRTVIVTLPVGSNPSRIAANSAGTRAYAANYDSGTLSVIDAQSNRVSATFAPGPYPSAIAVSPDGNRVYVANYHRIAVFDAADNALVAEVDTGSPASAMALNASGTRLYVAGDYMSNTVWVIDTANNSVIGNIAVAAPAGIAVTPDGTRLYVTGSNSKSVSVINTETNAVIQTVGVGSNPRGIAVNAAGTRVYAANSYDHSVSVIDTADHAVLATVPAGRYPVAVAITPDGHDIYIGSDNGIAAIDAATNTVAANIALPYPAPGLAFVQLPTGFIPQGGAALSAIIVSNAVTVSGINVAASVNVTGGQYEVSTDGGENWSGVASPPTTVNNGDQIRVHLTSSSQLGTTSSAALYVGGVSSSFYATTQASGDTPDATAVGYTFHKSLPLAIPYESDLVQIKGLSAGTTVPLRISGGEFSVKADGATAWGDWSSASGTTSVQNTDWVKIRGTTATVPGQTKVVELRAGGQTWVLYLTTQPATLGSLSVAGPATVNAGASASYSASATWTYSASSTLAGQSATPGTQASTQVAPAWSTGGTAASISADGVLASSAVTIDTIVPITASYTHGGVTKTAQYDVTIVGSGDTATSTTTSTTTSTSTTTTSGSSTTTTGSTTTTTLGGTGGPVTLNFSTGWNLVGNSVDANLDVATAFADTAKVTTVWKWVANSAKWAFYAPSLVGQALTDYATSKGYDVLATIAGGEGFWVNAKGDFAAQLPSGNAISSGSYQDPGTGRLVKGWNLIAIGDNKTPSEFNEALSATPPAPDEIPLNVTTLWAWDNGQSAWYFYAPILEKNGGLSAYIQQKSYLDFGTKVLDSTTGFWVNKP